MHLRYRGMINRALTVTRKEWETLPATAGPQAIFSAATEDIVKIERNSLK